MTRNQLTYWQNRETQRHNIATENLELNNQSITSARDTETARHNKAQESENIRHNTTTEQETHRNNVHGNISDYISSTGSLLRGIGGAVGGVGGVINDAKDRKQREADSRRQFLSKMTESGRKLLTDFTDESTISPEEGSERLVDILAGLGQIIPL